jgi:soluble lytic murein transglycosylase
MQLLPATAKGIALHTGGMRFRVADLYEPEINVRYGSFYLRRLLTKYGDTRLALAAYNAGQANVDGWLEANEGIAFPETREYVDSVLELRDIYADAYKNELGLDH